MRVRWQEMSLERVVAAVGRRFADVPEAAAWRMSPRARRARQQLEAFRGRHAGQRCFVIGNGPSLGAMDLSPLRGEITFGMNRIYLLFEKLGFATTYFTCINGLVLEQFAADIAALPMPKFVDWTARRHFAESDSLLFLRSRLSVLDFFEGDVTRPICSGGTVTYATLQLAYFMGFAEAILIGVDHNFADKGTPNREEVRQAERDLNHFHPDYFPKGSRWQLPDLLRSEQAYAMADRAFTAAGRKVRDATVGGRCPVFEKAAYATLFRG